MKVETAESNVRLDTERVYEVLESRFTPGEWRVECIDYANEGVGYIAIFSGPDSEERARKYAAWKNGG